jgi:hypothetical protein
MIQPRQFAGFALILAAAAGLAEAQTAQALISGTVRDGRSGRGIAARIVVTGAGQRVQLQSDAAGRFSALLLPPGSYRVRVDAAGFQAQEVRQLELRVAGRIELQFPMRPLADVWDAGRYRSQPIPGTGAQGSEAVVTYFGPDMDTIQSGSFSPNRGSASRLESAISDAVEPGRLRELPLVGRDTYTLLALQPGVTSDGATARGLGLSVMGQRPSSGSFLLDGVEINNNLLSGPAAAAAPEAIAEYRLSTAAYSAEFGRTSGFVANAITVAGGSTWHGLLYGNLKNSALNANSFARNTSGLPRKPLREGQTGVRAGGPVIRNQLSASLSTERLTSRSVADDVTVQLPATGFDLVSTGQARELLRRFPPFVRPASRAVSAPVTTQPPSSIDRWTSIARADWTGRWGTLSARTFLVRFTVPDFSWSPYPDFVSALEQPYRNTAVNWAWRWRPRVANEFRAALSRSQIGWERPHPEIPALAEAAAGTVLPGSPLFDSYQRTDRLQEWSDGVTWVLGGHILKAGGNILRRQSGIRSLPGGGGQFVFETMLEFGAGTPSLLRAGVARGTLPRLRLGSGVTAEDQLQAALYVQDTWKLTRQLTLNVGLRQEQFRAPRQDGRALYANQSLWLGRFGVSFAPQAEGRWLLRAAYGLYADRAFDNLWQTVPYNNLALESFLLGTGGIPYDYLRPLAEQLPRLEGQPLTGVFPDTTRIDPALRDALVQTFFAGIESRWGGLTLESAVTGALGRRLLTTDWVQRGTLPRVRWRSHQGTSDYVGLQNSVRWKHSLGLLIASYTWSRAADTQSEPLAGEFFDLSYARVTASASSRRRAQFEHEGDSSGERGAADFDQRHNFTAAALWEWRGWRFSHLAAVRSGFPYSVTAGERRAAVLADPAIRRPIPGGYRLLTRSAFAEPGAGAGGARNSFRGPGLASIDASVARTIGIRERWRLTLRADLYNVLNRANLGNPESDLFSPDFGAARYGRQGRDAGFPTLRPLTESPREVQLMLRLEF